MKNSSVVKQVEAEYGQPFWDVVKGYADDGESMNATARILGYSSTGAFHKLVVKHGKKELFKPGIETNSFKESGKRNPLTEKRIKQLKALQASHFFEFEGVLDSIAGHAKRKGINRVTVGTRMKAGWSLESALNTPVQKPRYYPRKKGNQDHPWRNVA